jgi:hypothetical protein
MDTPSPLLPPPTDAALPVLTVEEYDRRQAAARVRATYPAIRSFAPAAFAQVNFPTQVAREEELRRYADIMYEIADREHWLNRLEWSAAEQGLILALRAEIEALTARLYGRPVQPLMCLFPPLPILRLVEAAAAHRGRRLRIVEVGPGSGFLGAYCLLRGHRYVGTDNTQALYLWQHRLFRWLARGDLADYAFSDTPPAAIPPARAALVPWWHFAELYRHPPLKVDVLVCDAAIGEMDPFAARYLIHLAKMMLQDSDLGLFVYQNLGEERLNTRGAIQRLFEGHGYKAFACGSLHVHSASRSVADDLLYGLSSGPPPVDAGGNAAVLLPAAKFLKVDPDRLMESYAFFDFLRLDLG